MITAGDEAGRTQQGNNNAYCHDSPLTWLDWNFDEEQQELMVFVRMLTRLRREQPVFRRRGFFQGRPIYGAEIKDIYWVKSDGTEMTEEIGVAGVPAASAWALWAIKSGKPARGVNASAATPFSSCSTRTPFPFHSCWATGTTPCDGSRCSTRNILEWNRACWNIEPFTRLAPGRWRCCARNFRLNSPHESQRVKFFRSRGGRGNGTS